ncbi:MAG: hypothetical protein OXQ84_16115, partial [bacterium]|nr:hypothetical protein [bacterium]
VEIGVDKTPHSDVRIDKTSSSETHSAPFHQSPPTPSRLSRFVSIEAHWQGLGPLAVYAVVALRQHDWLRRMDTSAGDRQIGERAPCCLGEEAPEMDLDLRQGGKRIEINLLAAWRARIELPGDSRNQVSESVDCALRGKETGGEPDRIQPFEAAVLQRSVIQVEPVYQDPRSHAGP